MRLLLFGGNGQVGHALQGFVATGNELTVATRQDCDLDGCGERAFAGAARAAGGDRECGRVHRRGQGGERSRKLFRGERCRASVMAAEAAALGAKLVHYSTDYVFDGSKATPYVEEDPTGPRNVYGASKLAGEQGIAEAGGEFLILRTSWVYSNHGANFLKTMLRLRTERPELRIVADQHGAPTSADAIADGHRADSEAMPARGAGQAACIHMTAAGATTWYGFAKAIFARAAGPMPSLVPIATAEYPTPASRPANSILSNDKFAAHFGFRLPDWEQQLDAVMAARAIAS